MAQRLAPMVRRGLLQFDEVADFLVETALERGMCEDEGRLAAVEEWATKTVIRMAGV